MKEKLEKEVEEMIDKKIKWAQTIRLYYGKNLYYHEVDLHDLIFAILDYCKVEVKPQYQKLIINKRKDKDV